ncbi:MAG: tetraacyldisaccharide 4'-kinase [Gammaproteobacteria bacterium]|nr:tetraacyldisaccharide 4'-kinase [Gammaproteobacteria bacterium]
MWYDRRTGGRWLRPLAGLYAGVIRLRRQLYRSGKLDRCRFKVPVIVVGNITAGGTGKTPLVQCLVARAQALGLQPGIVCRGYRGNARDWPRQVSANSDPLEVGDEAVLLAQQCGVPVVADPDRCAAVSLLLQQGIDLVISDDGLQHYRLHRDAEIVVVDGERWFGNEALIPAGPLREPLGRLDEVDLVVVNGDPRDSGFASMQLVPVRVRSLNGSQQSSLASWAGRRVHAIAGIGHPQRFFSMLSRHGIEVVAHQPGDHAVLAATDFDFDDELPVLMTSKDAVKADAINPVNAWVVEVQAEPDDKAAAAIDSLLRKLVTTP